MEDQLIKYIGKYYDIHRKIKIIKTKLSMTCCSTLFSKLTASDISKSKKTTFTNIGLSSSRLTLHLPMPHSPRKMREQAGNCGLHCEQGSP